MKKILLFLLLLVNLQLTTDNGSLGIGFGEVAAQSMQEEYLDGVTVYGGSNWTHCGCGKYVARSAYGYHIQEECSLREVQCKKCGIWYRVVSGHNCSKSSVSNTNSTESICEYCYRPKSQCYCLCAYCGKKVGNCRCSVTITGKRGGGGGNSGSGGSGVSGGSGNSDSNIGNPSQSQDDTVPPDKRQKINLDDLKNLRGVSIIKNLPNILHGQEYPMECVVRGFAFMMELNGADYNTVYIKLRNRAEEKDWDLKIRGIRPSEYEVFKDIVNYVEIRRDKYTISDIDRYIDNNYSIGTYYQGHFVVIIAYDSQYYYTAAGNRDGSATIYKKTELNHNPIYYIPK